jgi:hypothetical protein
VLLLDHLLSPFPQRLGGLEPVLVVATLDRDHGVRFIDVRPPQRRQLAPPEPAECVQGDQVTKMALDEADRACPKARPAPAARLAPRTVPYCWSAEREENRSPAGTSST